MKSDMTMKADYERQLEALDQMERKARARAEEERHGMANMSGLLNPHAGAEIPLQHEKATLQTRMLQSQARVDDVTDSLERLIEDLYGEGVDRDTSEATEGPVAALLEQHHDHVANATNRQQALIQRLRGLLL